MQAVQSRRSNAFFAVDGYFHTVLPYLCLSSRALLDSCAGQGGGSHKTREEPGEDVANPKGDEFLRERTDDREAADITFSSPKPFKIKKANLQTPPAW